MQFRRAEYFFTQTKYRDAESAYQAIIVDGRARPRTTSSRSTSSAGRSTSRTSTRRRCTSTWRCSTTRCRSATTSISAHEEEDERRVADTFRVISLSFSNLGGPRSSREYFAANGSRSYEDRVYSNLGEYYLDEAALPRRREVVHAFVDALSVPPRGAALQHARDRDLRSRAASRKLVLESKRDFARDYGLQAEYWRHFDVDESPEVLSYLKTNLKDLANHYHAQYQDETLAGEKPANYREALRWYREYLASFPQDSESPPINYQLADLLLENKDFGEAPREYERTAYDYPRHDALVRRGLRRDLRAPRAPEGRRRGAASRGSARDGRRARSSSPTRSPSTSTRRRSWARPPRTCTR